MASPHQQQIKLVLVGILGHGKSATGNTIVGEEECFETGIGHKPVTRSIQTHTTSINGLDITVVDTPGIEDILDMDKYLQKDKAVYALVIRIGRFPIEERDIITKIFAQYYSVLDHVLIIFTHKEELTTTPDPETKTLKGWLKKVPTLGNLIASHKIRFIAFENSDISDSEKEKQRLELCRILQTVDFTEERKSGLTEKHKLNGTETPIPKSKERCPVSDTNEEYVRVTRQQMHVSFGEHGDQFFNEQLASKKQVSNSLMMEIPSLERKRNNDVFCLLS